MGTQAVEIAATPTTVLVRCAAQPAIVLLDGQGPSSWDDGKALLTWAPHSTLRVNGFEHAEVNERGVVTTWSGDPFALLQRFCAAHVPAHAPGDGRLVLAALNYDLRRCIERFPRPVASDSHLPLLVAAAYDWTLIHSYRTHGYLLQTPDDSGVDLRAITARLQDRSALPNPPTARFCARPESPRSAHAGAVQKILDYIAAGDVYQVNLAQRFVARGGMNAAAVFKALQDLNAVPYGAYASFGDFTLLSNSPECLLTLRGDRVSTAPIKGTRPRGATREQDFELQRVLTSDPKERAEHVMVVDLERNDLGRVCRTGSIRVEQLAELHTFPALHHMISTVHGIRRSDAALGDLLRAIFPGGSVTGAPKIRAMQIIDELEPCSRGFYTGSIGRVRALDDVVFSLTIRTATVQADSTCYWAGGGIVADSDPDREYDESLLKARPFLLAMANPSV